MNIVGAENHIEIGHLLQHPGPFLLGDATTDGQDQLGIALLKGLETAQMSVNLAFRPSSDGTGIEQNQVGSGRFRHRPVAQLPQLILDLLGINHIHLATERFQVIFFHFEQSLC